MTVVLLHPVALDARSWDWVGRPLSVAVDLPGHGDAAAPAGDVSLGGLADYVLHAVPGALDVAGVSLGGMVALHMAIRSPERVRSMLVACSTAWTDRAVLQARAEATRQHGMSGTLETTLERWFSDGVRDDVDHPGVAYVRRRLLSDDPEVVARYWTAMAEHDVRSLLPGVLVPTTVLAATHDRASSLVGLKEMADALPVSRFVTCPGSHLLHVEAGGLFSAELDRHLAWVDQLDRPAVAAPSPDGRA